jgi:UDP-N-acetylmuramate--alanine ligase
MAQLSKFQYIYFLGIGGIGMSALARWFKAKGYEVAGYDKTSSELTQQLQNEGIEIHFEENITKIPAHFLEHSEKTLVVYTPAVPKQHIEYQYFIEKNIQILKRSEVLGLITQNFFTIAIAGTHGKTTTSAMLAHLLQTAQKPLTAFIGGIAQNYDTNLLLSNDENALIVVEADEYDRSFLTLSPDIAIITSTDADHLDIYGNHQSVLDSFEEFIKKIKPHGTLFLKEDLVLNFQNSYIQSHSFGLEKGDIVAKNIRIENHIFCFDVQFSYNYNQDIKKEIKNVSLMVAGYHNILNSLAAISVGYQLGIDLETIKKAICSFKGVKRRFEYILNTPKIIQIDDYAHHPEEIKAFLTSVKALYPNKKITAIFQPHLYSRTRDFADAFAESLSLVQEVILLPIYPARELPIEGISSEMLLSRITSIKKQVLDTQKVISYIQDSFQEIVLTIGAGNIDALIEPLKQILQNK